MVTIKRNKNIYNPYCLYTYICTLANKIRHDKLRIDLRIYSRINKRGGAPKGLSPQEFYHLVETSELVYIKSYKWLIHDSIHHKDSVIKKRS